MQALISLVFLCWLMLTGQTTQTLFCPPTCMDYIRACSDLSPGGCLACSVSIYHMKPHYQGSNQTCVLLNQTKLLTYELENNPQMSIEGYHSSQTQVVTVGNYSFAGAYTSQDYLWKNFSNLPSNRYGITLRFSVGYVGMWNKNDRLRLVLKDEERTAYFDYDYNKCDYKSSEKVETFGDEENSDKLDQNTTICIRNQEYNLTSHFSEYIILNFTALTTQTNSSVQFWGIKELMLIARLCHDACSTCSGYNYNNCLTCSPNYYLQGSTCLSHCEDGFYHLPQKRLCVKDCPQRYFEDKENPEFYKCMPCQKGCLSCNTAESCLVWQSQDEGGFWHAKIQVWIVFVIIVVVVVVAVVYKVIRRTVARVGELQQRLHKDQEKVQTKSSGLKINNQQNIQDNQEINISKVESNLHLQDRSQPEDRAEGKAGKNFWFNELVELEEEVPQRKRRRRQAEPSEFTPDNTEL